MIRKVVVAGGGVLGSQIAFQSAYCGFDVTIWLRSEGSIGPVSYTHLDVYKRQLLEAVDAFARRQGDSDVQQDVSAVDDAQV